jgi:predicted HAD superfamily Cof-like phosphohydrolase
MFHQVAEFHRAFNLPHPPEPTQPSDDLRALRHRILMEEWGEFCDAETVVDVADALADMAYLVCGTAISYGIDPPQHDLWLPDPLPVPPGPPRYDLDQWERESVLNSLENALDAYNRAEGSRLLTRVRASLRIVLGQIWLGATIYRIPLQAVFDEVHASNMTKLGPDGKPIYREDGKVMKGPSFRQPDLAAVLRAHGWQG